MQGNVLKTIFILWQTLECTVKDDILHLSAMSTPTFLHFLYGDKVMAFEEIHVYMNEKNITTSLTATQQDAFYSTLLSSSVWLFLSPNHTH